MTSEYIRLYISPFDAELQDRIIPPSSKGLVKNISFHTVQTSPEKGFGYVSLPSAEAQRLRAKLSGMTLKGHKLKIQEAKPRNIPCPIVEEAADMTEKQKRSKREKRVHENGVISGVELGEGRRVKRGWSEIATGDDRKKKRRKQSQDEGGGSELSANKRVEFRMKLPSVTRGDVSANPKIKKQRTQGRKKGREGQVVLKEFSHSSKVDRPTVESRKSKRSGGYESDKGWADEDGNIVEGPSVSKKAKQSKAQATIPKTGDDATKVLDSPISLSHPVESESESESEDKDEDEDETASSSEEADSDKASGRKEQEVVGESDEAIIARDVHPLEALFKRPAPITDVSAKRKPAPIETSFSFFDAGEGDDEEASERSLAIPQTPHTKRDLEWRGVRSAAPTPDTAAIGGRFNIELPDADDNQDPEADSLSREDDEESEGPPDASGQDGSKGEESRFRKWFYENRGDLNRGWKKRRREERKLRRKRDNQRLSRNIA